MHTTIAKQLMLVTVAFALLAQASCISSQSAGLKAVTPEDAGLTWRECAIAGAAEPQQAESCFGHIQEWQRPPIIEWDIRWAFPERLPAKRGRESRVGVLRRRNGSPHLRRHRPARAL